MKNRPSTHECFMQMAEAAALRSTCPRLSVGAAVVDARGQIISTGYNGAPRGEPHCSESGAGSCEMEEGHCVTAVHAEINALLQAGRAALGGILYVTHYPCRRCWNAIQNSGIGEVCYRNHYRTPTVENFDSALRCPPITRLPSVSSIKLVYVAGPYTAPTVEGIRKNIELARSYGKTIALSGGMPVIPHANTNETFLGIQNPQFWYDGTMRLLEACDAVMLVRGWELSRGAVAEKNRADELGLPVFSFVDLDTAGRFETWLKS